MHHQVGWLQLHPLQNHLKPTGPPQAPPPCSNTSVVKLIFHLKWILYPMGKAIDCRPLPASSPSPGGMDKPVLVKRPIAVSFIKPWGRLSGLGLEWALFCCLRSWLDEAEVRRCGKPFNKILTWMIGLPFIDSTCKNDSTGTALIGETFSGLVFYVSHQKNRPGETILNTSGRCNLAEGGNEFTGVFFSEIRSRCFFLRLDGD